jgi:hypothetical protein
MKSSEHNEGIAGGNGGGDDVGRRAGHPAAVHDLLGRHRAHAGAGRHHRPQPPKLALWPEHRLLSLNLPWSCHTPKKEKTTDADEETETVPLTTRWPESGAMALSTCRMPATDKALSQAWGLFFGRVPWEAMATLTFDPKRVFPVSSARAWAEATDWCSRLGYIYRRQVDWLCATERGRSGTTSRPTSARPWTGSSSAAPRRTRSATRWPSSSGS